jgi:hypothetical protein
LLKSQKSQNVEEKEKRVKLNSQVISSELYISVEFDEVTGIVYIVLNRTSFAITLEEFAHMTISVNDAFNMLTQHPKIMLAMNKDEVTQEEIPEFIYYDDTDDEFVN